MSFFNIEQKKADRARLPVLSSRGGVKTLLGAHPSSNLPGVRVAAHIALIFITVAAALDATVSTFHIDLVLVSGRDRVGGERGAVDPLPIMPIGQLS